MEDSFFVDFTGTNTNIKAPDLAVIDGQPFNVLVLVPTHYGMPLPYMSDDIRFDKSVRLNIPVLTLNGSTLYLYTFTAPPSASHGKLFSYEFKVARDLQPRGTKNKRPTPNVGFETKTATGSIEVSGGPGPYEQLKGQRRTAVRRRSGRSTRG